MLDDAGTLVNSKSDSGGESVEEERRNLSAAETPDTSKLNRDTPQSFLIFSYHLSNVIKSIMSMSDQTFDKKLSKPHLRKELKRLAHLSSAPAWGGESQWRARGMSNSP